MCSVLREMETICSRLVNRESWPPRNPCVLSVSRGYLDITHVDLERNAVCFD